MASGGKQARLFLELFRSATPPRLMPQAERAAQRTVNTGRARIRTTAAVVHLVRFGSALRYGR